MNCLECSKDTPRPKFCSELCFRKFSNRKHRLKERNKECRNCSEKLLSNRIYCDKCWEVCKKNPRPNKQFLDNDGIKPSCKICGVIKSDENCKRFKNNRYDSYCRKCNNDLQTIKHREFKTLCVEYKGGKCQCCGYNRCYAALQFHHKDFFTKSFQISHKTSLSDDVKLELDKCILLCSNCHFEKHTSEKTIDNRVLSYITKSSNP